MSHPEEPFSDQVGKSATGVVSFDPLRDQPVGASITFSPISFGGSNANDRPQSVYNWEFLKGAVLGVVLKSANSSTMIGTAVMIAPGIAITASHIFSDVLGDLPTGAVVPYCIGIRETTLEIWTVLKFSYDQGNDIAFLSVAASSKLPEDGQYYRMGLTTRAPKNGEKLHIVGFRSETLVEEPQGHKFAGHMFTSLGAVTAVYPCGRDRVLMPYPVIELNCGSLGGMSGGAAIDEHGFVMGIVSRGFETVDGDGPTYVSWIINAMGRVLEAPWPPGLYKTPVSPLSLDDRLIIIQGRDALAGTTEKETVYKIWFE